MTVTFKVASHAAVQVQRPYRPPSSTNEFLCNILKFRSASKEVLQTSLTSVNEDGFLDLRSNDNGFVNTIIDAYNSHHHLVFRPDDVWIAILGQFNFYVNAHAEELRSTFVQHEGKKELMVSAGGSRYTVDFGYLATQMTSEIEKNVVDKDLKDWILPKFSTTTFSDTVVCAVMMMATLKAYFNYTMELCCGIPSVTLEGSKDDWEEILSRIDKLESFGTEPTKWAAMLRPILKRFVNAFDGNPDIDFWSRVCHYHSGGSGPTYLSGWITAFCVWSSTGKWQGPALSDPQPDVRSIFGRSMPMLTLDGVLYTPIDSSDVPPSHCEVDVKLNDNGVEFDCAMVSGHVGSLIEGEKKDTLRPLPAWFMFIKGEPPQSWEDFL